MLGIGASLSLVKDMKHKLPKTLNQTQKKRRENMKKRRKVLAVLLTLVCLMATSMSVCAAEAGAKSEETVTEVSKLNSQSACDLAQSAVTAVARSASGYAAHYTDSQRDSFYITVSGSGSILGTAKIKAWDFPSGTDVYATLYRPDGSAAVSNIRLPIGQELTKTFTNLQPGTYELSYQVYSVNRGWIYCNIN